MLAAWWNDLQVAAAFLTRWPVFAAPAAEDYAEDTEALPDGALAPATRAFPLVGFCVGLAGAVILAAARWLGLGNLVAAALGIGTVIALTGALHEDGLADAADGFGAGRDRDAKLTIMRDTRIGAFGMLALILSVILRVGALAAIPGTLSAGAAMIAAASLSRAVIPAVMANLEPARLQGLAVSAGKPPQDRVIAAGLLGALFVLLLLGPFTGFIALLCGVGAASALALFAKKQIGGYTGDVLGAIQQITEIAVLLVAVAA